HAVGRRDWALVRRLDEHGVRLGERTEFGAVGLIHQYVSNFGDVPDVVQWLVDHGACVDFRGPNDWTPLHFAARLGYVGSVKALVGNGADVNATSNVDGGWTPLMAACAGGQNDVVKYLLDHGADRTRVNNYEVGTCREIAVKNGHKDTAEVVE